MISYTAMDSVSLPRLCNDLILGRNLWQNWHTIYYTCNRSKNIARYIILHIKFVNFSNIHCQFELALKVECTRITCKRSTRVMLHGLSDTHVGLVWKVVWKVRASLL